MKKSSLIALVLMSSLFMGSCDRYNLDPITSFFLNNDHYTADKNQVVHLDVLSNDEINGEVNVTVEPSNYGNITLEDGRSVFRYSPKKDFVGVDNFSYTVCDLNGNCKTAQIAVNIIDKEQDCSTVLDAIDDSQYMDVNAKLVFSIYENILDNDIGCDQEILLENFKITKFPKHGDLEQDGKYLYYTPDLDYKGWDQFEYTIKSAFNKLESDKAYVVLGVGEQPTSFNKKHGEETN